MAKPPPRRRPDPPQGTGEQLDLGLFKDMVEGVVGSRGARWLMWLVLWLGGGVLLTLLASVLFDWGTVAARLFLLGWLVLPAVLLALRRLHRRR